MEVIFNEILSATWILYYLNGKYSPYIHIEDVLDFLNHFFLFGCELNHDGFCPFFVFLSGIKKVDVYKMYKIFKEILNGLRIAIEILLIF